MSQNPEARLHGLQPPLPLVVADEEPSDRAPSGIDTTEWRLDAHTRAVGRRGIAAARARLRSSARPEGRSEPGPGPGRGPGPGTPRSAPGRAA